MMASACPPQSRSLRHPGSLLARIFRHVLACSLLSNPRAAGTRSCASDLEVGIACARLRLDRSPSGADETSSDRRPGHIDVGGAACCTCDLIARHRPDDMVGRAPRNKVLVRGTGPTGRGLGPLLAYCFFPLFPKSYSAALHEDTPQQRANGLGSEHCCFAFSPRNRRSEREWCCFASRGIVAHNHHHRATAPTKAAYEYTVHAVVNRLLFLVLPKRLARVCGFDSYEIEMITMVAQRMSAIRSTSVLVTCEAGKALR